MTKRKRTPPPTPKPLDFKIPSSLTALATQCRHLREQAEKRSAQTTTPISFIASHDQALDHAADEQLNAQLNATLSSPQSPPAPPQRRHRRPKASTISQEQVLLSLDDELYQSLIRDAEEQLGIAPELDVAQPTQLQTGMQDITNDGPVAQSQYQGQSSMPALRFNPYIPAGDNPYYLADQQMPLGSDSQYSQASMAQNTSSYRPLTTQYPYTPIAPGPAPPSNPRGTLDYSLPYAGQAGYYRLPPSYWQQPSLVTGSSMTEANRRTLTAVSAHQAHNSSNPGPQPSLSALDHNSYIPTASTSDLSMSQNPSTFPDPSIFPENGIIMDGDGVFRNLTKERFGKYTVGGRLVGSGQ
ncbi:hypothetical protein UCRPC4_g00519 [Phaeomoniella chlamydospora]|uniref:Uncharacterized protein n=1 Tax=Phaeomoniella chlamydospora TaxID=158046 RepID=A0A0G2F199_PHACM|nr:hypothetical protein UCRPC4_g00519 [Phaeomoniella chlamydospora]